MMNQPRLDIHNFFIVGINYKKTDAAVRGQFAIGNAQYQNVLQQANQSGLKELFIISTCNRTEIYGVARNAYELMSLLCSQTEGTLTTFQQLAYIKNGVEAVNHLFSVAAGLDSQILGDYEIVGQMKQAIKFAKDKGFVGTLLERLTNGALQSSKAIKTNTELSGGTVSVSFAAIQYLRDRVSDIQNKQILLVGIGKIGRNTCKNLVDYLNTTQITLINRTPDKAVELANQFGIQTAPYHTLDTHLQQADIVLVATNAPTPIISKKELIGSNPKILIDLSIPNNIEAACAELSHITLINVDELSKLKDETLQKREAEVPKAKAYIAQYIAEFNEWYEMRRHVPVLKAVKQKLIDMHQCNMYISCQTAYTQTDTHNVIPFNDTVNTQAIQKVINSMAVKLRNNNTKGCHYIEAINDYIATASNA